MTFSVANDRLVKNGAEVPFVPSPNIGGRIEPSLIVVHFTADHLRPDDSVSWFSQRKSRVSAHLVLGRDGSITQMVDFDRRAWHCDPSEWQGLRHVNGRSIGIEVDNPGRLAIKGKNEGVAWFGQVFDRERDGLVEIKSDKYGHALWLPFTDVQIETLKAIIAALSQAYPIVDVRGHDEICVPYRRKNDPGPLMDMEALRDLLGDRGIPDTVTVSEAQSLLVDKGYSPGDVDGIMGPNTRAALRAFQEQNEIAITGTIDAETWQALVSEHAKAMPTGSREQTTKRETASAETSVAKVALGSAATVTTGYAMATSEPLTAPPVAPPPEPATAPLDAAAPDPAQILDTLNKGVGQAETARSLAERAAGLGEWFMTRQGMAVLITLLVCLVAYLAVERIDWKALMRRRTKQT